MLKMFSYVLLAIAVLAAPAFADKCDDALAVSDAVIEEVRTESLGRQDALITHLETKGMEGYAELACQTARANLADFEKSAEARKVATAQCPSTRGYSCDEACMSKNRATLIATAEKQCDPATHE